MSNVMALIGSDDGGLAQMINAPPGCDFEWWRNVWSAWQHSKSGRIEASRACYQSADDELTDGYELNADLSVLRHNLGYGTGTVRPVPPTESDIVSCFLPYWRMPQKEWSNPLIIGVPTEDMMALEEPILKGDDRRHVMVLSTGRCGTVSLFRLFQGSNLEPYHSYWFMQHPYARWEFMCRLAVGQHDNTRASDEWVATRKAEWLGEKPMIGLNHIDTVYAPAFAAVIKNSRFVYLRRDPADVFKSFIDKNQWVGGVNHFRPARWDGVQFSLPPISSTDGTLYHLYYTEAFSRIFGRVMGDRWIEISADRLFGQDREEVAKLLEFVGSDIDLDVAVEHFATKINEKAFRVA